MLKLLTLLAPLLFNPALDAPAKPEPATLKGRVVELAEALKDRKIEADPEPIEREVVLVTDRGEVVPLISDEASRALFLDKRLRRREAEIVGRRFPGLPMLQVVTFRVMDEGRLRTPEYYCEICAISVRYPQTCPCCQGPMILRMKAEGH